MNDTDPWGDPYPRLDWPRHCQLCGDPLTPGQDGDVHPECAEQFDADELEDAARTLADLEAADPRPPMNLFERMLKAIDEYKPYPRTLADLEAAEDPWADIHTTDDLP